MHNFVQELIVGSARYRYHSLPAAATSDPNLAGLLQLPYSLRILAENLLRHGAEPTVEPGMLRALAH